jgi:hypothetical protein
VLFNALTEEFKGLRGMKRVLKSDILAKFGLVVSLFLECLSRVRCTLLADASASQNGASPEVV